MMLLVRPAIQVHKTIAANYWPFYHPPATAPLGEDIRVLVAFAEAPSSYDAYELAVAAATRYEGATALLPPDPSHFHNADGHRFFEHLREQLADRFDQRLSCLSPGRSALWTFQHDERLSVALLEAAEQHKVITSSAATGVLERFSSALGKEVLRHERFLASIPNEVHISSAITAASLLASGISGFAVSAAQTSGSPLSHILLTAVFALVGAAWGLGIGRVVHEDHIPEAHLFARYISEERLLLHRLSAGIARVQQQSEAGTSSDASTR